MSRDPAEFFSIGDLSREKGPNRVRLFGAVTAIEISDKGVVQLWLDDGTGHVQVRGSSSDSVTSRVLQHLQPWRLLEVVGRVITKGEDSSVAYIQAELAQEVTDHNCLLLHRLTRLSSVKRSEKRPQLQEKRQVREVAEPRRKEIPESRKFTQVLGSSLVNAVYQAIGELDRGRGASMEQIVHEVKASEVEVTEAIIELLSQGQIIEPRPAYYKLLPDEGEFE